MNAVTHPRRPLTALALCLGLLVSLSSCRLPHTKSVPAAAFSAAPTGTDLAAAARFLDPSDDVPGFFQKLLPDSGIVPIRVSMRNTGAGRFLMHNANGMDLGPAFEGCALYSGGQKYLPLHPRQVAGILVGARRIGRYRPAGTTQFFTGTLIAPLGGYYLWGEIDVGRYYRPLFKHSLYPALEGGLAEPIRLGPSEEKDGFLYFALPHARDRAACELRIYACVSAGVRDTVAGYDFKFARDDMPPAAGRDSTGLVFKLVNDGASEKPDLFACDVRQLMTNSHAAWMPVAPALAKSASIVDASRSRSIAVCAVNFKAKSKVVVLQCGDRLKVIGEQSFSRRIKRVFAMEAGILVITADDFCHVLAYPSLTVSRSVVLVQGLEEAALVDSRLWTFSKGKRLDVFGTSGDQFLRPLERRVLRRGVRQFIGSVHDELWVLNKGSRARPDTLVIFGIEAKAELRRAVLPGTVVRAAVSGSDLLAQLEDGTLLRIVPEPRAVLAIAEAAYLPFLAEALKAVPRGFVALDASGACAIASIGDFKPGTNGVLEVLVPVQ
jgi:hypothetical protein